jgi:hypothetical protein
MLQPCLPLALVYLSVLPLIPTTTLRLSPYIPSTIGRTIAKTLESQTISHILNPMPLENPPTRIEHNSAAMTLTILCLSPIYRISIPLCLSTLHLLNINDIRNWPILFKREKKTLDNESIFWILIGSRSILIGSTSIEVGLNLF